MRFTNFEINRKEIASSNYGDRLLAIQFTTFGPAGVAALQKPFLLVSLAQGLLIVTIIPGAVSKQHSTTGGAVPQPVMAQSSKTTCGHPKSSTYAEPP